MLWEHSSSVLENWDQQAVSINLSEYDPPLEANPLANILTVTPWKTLTQNHQANLVQIPDPQKLYEISKGLLF